METQPIYYGSITCQAIKKDKQPCTNKAYYTYDNKYCCGVHSNKSKRTELSKDPNANDKKTRLIELHQQSVRDQIWSNGKNNRKGEVKCYKMQMMKEVPLIDGWRNVFPNNKHQTRKDGYGCAELSPMQLGPVLHCQPGLPCSMNVENYHQANKVYPNEVETVDNGTRKVLPIFYETQKKLYEDKVPHRHKYDPATMKSNTKKLIEENIEYAANKNIPLFSIHKTLDGIEKEFTYVQSRYFYCKAYEILAKRTKSFVELLDMLNGGANLVICGYDARDITDEDLDTVYADPYYPFGHELVLYALLTIVNEEYYPWNKYAKQYSDVYHNVACMTT